MTKTERLERMADMSRRFRDGETLQAIGDSYGLTRERVRQILKKAGITGNDGGSHVRGHRNAYKRHLKRKFGFERRTQERYGISYEKWQELRGDGPYKECPISRYHSQRKNAHHRGIGWEFTLGTWWAMWEASGKWKKRGVGHGYVMARIGDTGPYSPDNCVIVSAVENIMEYYQREKGVDPTATLACHGIKRPTLVQAGKPGIPFEFALALFPSRRQMYLRCGVSVNTVSRWEQAGFVPKSYEQQILDAVAKRKEAA